MLKREITYTDYNGDERTETFYFNLTETELTELQTSIPGGMAAYMSSVAAANDVPKMMQFFKKLIMTSYAEKSQDGRRLMKDNGKLAEAFIETPAYDIIFQEIFTKDGGMVDFITGIMPIEVAEKLRPAMKQYMESGKLPAAS